jgi:NhaA family Na+:H+ antiporter
MAVFFLLVGLEMKRELLEGELSEPAQALLPAIAALGGMVAPAGIFVAFNAHDPVALRGWAIPTATDIAFALGVLSLLGARVPLALKVFLTAVAIFDDLGAIMVIAAFYTDSLSLASLIGAAAATFLLIVLNLAGVTRRAPYVLVGIALWICVLKSGVHATLAGVVLALAIPLRARDAEGHAPLVRLEHLLHPWVAFGIMPIFAFANAGVSLAGLTLATLAGPVPLGIAGGLFVGKQVGVFGAVWLAVKTGLVRPLAGASWSQVYGVALLTGIGFTMSLFIGTLAFSDAAYAAQTRFGVLGGSLISGIAGYLLLRLRPAQQSLGVDGDAG